jgi:hypothetical protein
MYAINIFILIAFVAFSAAAPTAQEVLKTSQVQKETWHGDIAVALIFKGRDCKCTRRN